MGQEVEATAAERRRRNAEATPNESPRPPGVEAVLSKVRTEFPTHDEPALAAVVRAVVDSERERLRAGEPARPADELADQVRATVAAWAGAASSVVPVINATGVILHTNLGRASWPAVAIEAAAAAAREPLLLELDRGTGRRGGRYRVAEEHLVALTAAEDALVVNNNAAAVALAVGLAGRRGVAVARGELVEIGGGVRIPEIVRRAGARLVEVGTTNRTHLADFAEVLAGGRVAVVLRVHASNFRQSGFVEAPDPRALAALAHEHGALVVDDLGSGALLDTADFGLAHEPTPGERLAEGADVVTFSGDKLVGGPQAGLIVGRAELVARLRRDPLARAMRPGKATLAAVAATLGLYRAGAARREIPVWGAIAAAPDELRRRAGIVAEAVAEAVADAVAGAVGDAVGRAVAQAAATVRVAPVESTVGGGSLPGETLASFAVGIRPARPSSADRLLARLRLGTPCVVGRIERGEVLLDVRTVEPARDAELAEVLARAILDPAD